MILEHAILLQVLACQLCVEVYHALGGECFKCGVHFILYRFQVLLMLPLLLGPVTLMHSQSGGKLVHSRTQHIKSLCSVTSLRRDRKLKANDWERLFLFRYTVK